MGEERERHTCVDVAAAVASAAPPLSACNARAWERAESKAGKWSTGTVVDGGWGIEVVRGGVQMEEERE